MAGGGLQVGLFDFRSFGTQVSMVRVDFSAQKQFLSKYTSLEEEQDNLVTRIFVPALEKVGTEAHKSKKCVHEKPGFFRI